MKVVGEIQREMDWFERYIEGKNVFYGELSGVLFFLEQYIVVP